MAPKKKAKGTTSTHIFSRKSNAEKVKAAETPKEETIVAKEAAAPATETASKAAETPVENAPASESKSPTEKKNTSGTAKETTAKTVAKEASAKASAKKEQVKEKASSAKKTVTEKATKAKESVKKNVSAGKEKAKAAVAKISATQETYFEIAGEQILMEEINEKIRQAWLAEGHYARSLKSIKTYLNIEERRAYYVINGNAENKYVEF